MKRHLSFILMLCFSCAAFNAWAQASDDGKYLNSMHRHITSEKLFHYVCELSDPALEGRLAGSPGMAKAVEIVKNYYAGWELAPAPGTQDYIQEYSHPCVEIKEGSYIEILFPIQGKGKEAVWLRKQYPWADGWFAGNNSGNGEIEAEIVYCGFGVSAPELGYDDYKGVDVKGKIVLIEGETPNKDRSPEAIAKWYKHTLHQTKLENAAKHGAAGLLYLWVPGPNALYNPDFIYCHVTRQVVDDIFLGTGKDYKGTIDKIYETKKPASFSTGKKAYIKMVSTYNPDATGKNLIGVIEGSDPVLKNEYVVISAHLDHLGMIPYHIEGANDNNASTAVLLGVAEALAKCEQKPKRSIVFLTLDGEEAGLTGSTFYTQNPLFPQDKVKAILNLEQMGTGSAFGATIAESSPQLESPVKLANEKYVHRRLPVGKSAYLTRPRTDGAVFAKAGYPVVDMRSIGGGFYHHPKDNTESINPEMLQSSAQWLYWTTILIANE